ncbi:Topoisomerase 1-associated factor 1 [Entomophthora muscae]|uniref:Topoisomerase 1-associated factor 1 n=2 Tax=Entomophthora muscae TaxID=34485 RepID=A0ACC2UT57_9FUNG|nr:Topoisomerase 1-associated factor 1 [Entomophthora muscae]
MRDTEPEFDPLVEVREGSDLKEYIHSICTALGGFEKASEIPAGSFYPDPSRRQNLIYTTGDECFECLKDLRKLLKQEENSLVKPVRLLLAEWNTFSEDLLPILALHPNFMKDKLGRTCFELVAYMMTPVVNRPFSNNLAKEIAEQEEMQDSAQAANRKTDMAEVDGADSNDELSEEDYESDIEDDVDEEDSPTRLSAIVAIKEHRLHQLRYKKAFLKNKWIFDQIMIQLAKLVQQPAWADEDERFLFAVMTLVKSLLCIEAPQEDKTFATVTTQDLLLECLDSSQMLDFLLSLMGSIQDRRFIPYAPLATDIIYCLFRFVDLEDLLSALQPDGSVADARITRDQLEEHTLAETQRTLNDLFTNPTRHSRFGGTNTFYMNKGKQPYLFSPDNKHATSLPTSGPEFARLQIASCEHLLKLLKLGKRESIRTRPRFRVDADHCHPVLHGPSRRKLLDFAFQYTKELAVQMFTATQRLAVGATTDDRGREAFVLMLTLNLAATHLKVCGDWTLVRSILPLLAGASLPHYLMSAISEFKDSKCFKALAVALKAFQAWLELLMCLHELPEGFSHEADAEKAARITAQLKEVGKHQLHNFVHDYALMRPLHDMFTSPNYHPFLLSTLIPATFQLNRVVKAVILYRSGSAFARLKAAPKRPKKKQKITQADHTSDVINEKPTTSPTDSVNPSQPGTPQQNPNSPAAIQESPDNPINKPSKRPADSLADTLFSDNDDDFIVQDIPHEETQQEESSDDQSEAKQFKEQSLDFHKYLRSYCSDGIMRCLLLYTESVLNSAPSPSTLQHQPQIHKMLDRKLQVSTALMHQLVVELGSIKLLHKAIYLHALRAFETKCREIKNAFLQSDRSAGLVCKLPSTLRWVGELERFCSYVFKTILESLKKDPWLLESLLPKSASKATRRALIRPATPPAEVLPLTASAPEPPQKATPVEPATKPISMDDDFDDEFFANLYAD